MLAGAEDHLAIFSFPGVSQTLMKNSTWGQCPPSSASRHSTKSCQIDQSLLIYRGGGFKRGGFPDLDLSFLFSPFWSFFVLLGLSPFPIFPGFFRDFPDLSRDGPGFSRFVPFLFLGLLRAPTGNSPRKGPRHNLHFSRRKWEPPPVWKPPRFSFSQLLLAPMQSHSCVMRYRIPGSCARCVKTLASRVFNEGGAPMT